MKRAVLVTVLFAASAGAVAAADLSGLAKNKWTVIHNGPPGIMGAHAKLEWVPAIEQSFMWPCYNYRGRHVSVADHARVFLYSPTEGQWEEKQTAYPKGMRTASGPDPSVAYVWMPGLKKLLFLHGADHRAKKPVRGWLVDPATWKWEPLFGDVRMSDRSADFNPSRCTDGGRWPIWGTLCYDAHNREAVLVGGCGTWGRVGKKKEPLEVGDWFYDEAVPVKRVRRLLASEEGEITEGRQWYPANCGTWAFSEETRRWAPIEHPMSEQPPGRILPGAVYDRTEKKVVMFGGDDFTGPLNDTWVYDCRTRAWTRMEPDTSPPPRATHALVYVPDQKAIVLAGGYGPGWKPLRDVWVYQTAANTWVKLAAHLPAGGYYFSGTVETKTGAVLVSTHPFAGPGWPKPWRGKKGKTIVMALKLDLESVRTAPPPKPLPTGARYHCTVDKQWGAPLPEEWRSPKNAGMDPEAGRKELSGLPANTWVLRKPPIPSRARQWGSYAYDPRNHKAYAWGGGHYGYTGCEMSEYDVLRNRWKSMNDVVAYKVHWRRGSAGGVPGPSFQGWRLMGTHARKSYAVDYKTDAVITLHGDIYSIDEERFVTCIGRCPGAYGAGDQVCFENTPDGVYGFHSKYGGQLWLADVAAGKWNLVKKGGPRGHNEYGTLCYDRKRRRLFYTVSPRRGDTQYWSYDIGAGKWTQLDPVNKSPGFAGCPTYVDALDAILWTWGQGDRRGRSIKGQMTLYKLDENRFYTAPWKGPTFGSHGNLNNSPHYDPALKLVVRLAHLDRNGYIPVGVMRLDPKSLELTDVE
jgi:hypothetical protein